MHRTCLFMQSSSNMLNVSLNFVQAGPEASALLAGAGFDSARNLSDVFAQGKSFDLHGSIARIVSCQTQWIAGQQVSCYMVEYNTPSEVATAEMVRLMFARRLS